MKITVDMDPRDVWRFQERADRLGVTPGVVLRDELAVKRQGRDRREAIRERVKAGMCDADIGIELGETSTSIRDVRRGLGLKANPRYPKRTAAPAAERTTP